MLCTEHLYDSECKDKQLFPKTAKKRDFFAISGNKK